MNNDVEHFILNISPLEELTEKFCDIAERYRFNLITLKQAKCLLQKECKNELSGYVSKNKEINENFF